MRDPLTKKARSRLMAKVRYRGNKSTEMRVESILRGRGLSGWRKHPSGVPGRPDFFFPKLRLAIFVDGCFWHGCSLCGRIPKTRVKFWTEKICSNRLRDDRIRRKLRRSGYATVRIWEHELKTLSWLTRLNKKIAMLKKAKSSLPTTIN
jgi:DNA mismatch endonuclease (patch repair protein)